MTDSDSDEPVVSALERLTDQLEIQNALLAEQTSQLARLTHVQMGQHPDDVTGDYPQSFVEDNLLGLRERVDFNAVDKWEGR